MADGLIMYVNFPALYAGFFLCIPGGSYPPPSPSIHPALHAGFFLSGVPDERQRSAFSGGRRSSSELNALCAFRSHKLAPTLSISPAFDAGVCFVNCFRISSGCVFLFRARVIRLAFIFFFIFRRLSIGSHVVHCPASCATTTASTPSFVPFSIKPSKPKNQKNLAYACVCEIFFVPLQPK